MSEWLRFGADLGWFVVGQNSQGEAPQIDPVWFVGFAAFFLACVAIMFGVLVGYDWWKARRK